MTHRKHPAASVAFPGTRIAIERVRRPVNSGISAIGADLIGKMADRKIISDKAAEALLTPRPASNPIPKPSNR